MIDGRWTPRIKIEMPFDLPLGAMTKGIIIGAMAEQIRSMLHNQLVESNFYNPELIVRVVNTAELYRIKRSEGWKADPFDEGLIFDDWAVCSFYDEDPSEMCWTQFLVEWKGAKPKVEYKTWL